MGFSSARYYNPALERQRQIKLAQAKQAKIDDEKRRADLKGKGILEYAQTPQEKRAGMAPLQFHSIRNLDTGNLLDQYKLDPYAGEATQALKAQAFGQGPSPWALMQLEQLKREQGGAMDAASRDALASSSAGMSNLAMNGGLSSGARERMARLGARDLLMARQGVNNQGTMGRMAINAADLDRKQGLLTNFANAEAGANTSNLNAVIGDMDKEANFSLDRYRVGMGAFGSQQSADAQRAQADAARAASKKKFLGLF